MKIMVQRQRGYDPQGKMRQLENATLTAGNKNKAP
jgi:hypothetical protein